VISAVGGLKIPPVERYIVGYAAGAKAANSDVKVLTSYSQDFVAAHKCKQLTLNQIGNGAQVAFQVAGQCGLGTLSAANDKGVWGIGVDADQAHLGDHVLTSAVKKVDVAVYDTIDNAANGTYNGGTNTVFTLKNDGVGLGTINDQVPDTLIDELRDIEAKLETGEIDLPTV
jgi:basic membrane protein A